MVNAVVTLIKFSDPNTDPRLIKEIAALKKNGYRINILCKNRLLNGNLNATDSCNVKEFNIETKEGLKSIIFWPIWWLFVTYWLTKIDCDIIHAQNYSSILPALIIGKLKNKVVIYEILDTSYDAINLPFNLRSAIIFFDKLLMRFSNAIILADENQIIQFNGIPNANISIIYDSALDIYQDYSSQSDEIDNGIFEILYVGVLYKIRHLNLDKLSRAVCDIDGVRLTIAGYGDLVEDIKKWESNSKGKIKFIGRISYTESLRLSLRADALIVLRDSAIRTNRYICGSKIWEAMMCGKPILVNSGTSTADKVNAEECGLIVNADEIQEIRDAIVAMRDNPQLCKELGSNARRSYEERYSWDLMEARLINLYINLFSAYCSNPG